MSNTHTGATGATGAGAGAATPGTPIAMPAQIIHEGAGKAYQSVAQSTAIAIQDATDNLRNLNTISTTAIGVALAQFIATKEPIYKEIIQEAQGVATVANTNFLNIGTNSAKVLQQYGEAKS